MATCIWVNIGSGNDLLPDGTNSVHENHRTCRTFAMTKPKCLMGDFTNLNRIYKAPQTNVWWTMKVFRLHCTKSLLEPLVRLSGIHLRAISQWVPELLFCMIGSVSNYWQSVSPKQTTLEEDRELFKNFSSILCLWFEIQGSRTDNFFGWVLNTVIGLKIILLKLLPHLPGANELTVGLAQGGAKLLKWGP